MSSLVYFVETLHTNLDYNMSNPTERTAEDNYERENDPSPVTEDFTENTYVKEPKSHLRGQVPVQLDEQSFEDPMQPPYSNSDQQLGKSEFSSLANSKVSSH